MSDYSVLRVALVRVGKGWKLDAREASALAAELETVRAQLTVARQALEEIEGYDTDFALGVDENCGAMRKLASDALTATDPGKAR